MSAPQNVIAVIFDFDDTLTDDSTTRLLSAHGIEPREFWAQANGLWSKGWNPQLAYLTLLLEHVGEDKALGKLSNARVREFGSSLEFYPGIPEVFTDLQKLTKEHPLTNPVVEFYVVSGGLEEIVRGSKIAEYMTGIWGCRFAEDESGTVTHISNVVSFTEKTKCLFEINKGVTEECRTNPFAVNEYKKPEERRIPFHNMIYVGNGLTDVPCFSLLEKHGGKAFGVFDPRKESSPKVAFEKLVAPNRVKIMNTPRYRKRDDLGAVLRCVISRMCIDMDIKNQSPSVSDYEPKHLHYEFHLTSNDIVEVTLDRRGNVRLMDDTNYSLYCQGKEHRYHGGLAKKSPVQIPVPRAGHWHLVIDLGGYGGTVQASIRVLQGAT